MNDDVHATMAKRLRAMATGFDRNSSDKLRPVQPDPKAAALLRDAADLLDPPAQNERPPRDQRGGGDTR